MAVTWKKYAKYDEVLKNIVEDTTPQLGGDLDLNGKYIDVALDPVDDAGEGIITTVTVGSGVGQTTIGQAMHCDTDGEFVNADADGVATMPCIGLLLTTGTGASKKLLLFGTIENQDVWAWTVGGIIYVSADPTTTCGLTQTAPAGAGDQVQVVGVALSADAIFFCPSLELVEIAA